LFALAFVTEHTAKVLAVQGRVMKEDSRVAPAAGDAERRHARMQAADVALTAGLPASRFGRAILQPESSP
jgi:hypothetical protein